jgi:VWFA-related protein
MNVHHGKHSRPMRRRRCAPRWTLFAIFAALAVAGLAAAQDSQDSQQQTPAPIRSETHAILISVSVRDSSGHAVENLQKEDFTVTDNGQRRDFVIFPNDSSPEPARRRTAVPDGFYSNAAGEAPEGRLTAILLDSVNTSIIDQASVREQVVHAIQGQAIHAIEQMAPGERVAVYALNPGITVLQDYTTDRNALLAAVRELHPQGSPWTMTPEAQPTEYSAVAPLADGSIMKSASSLTRKAMAPVFMEQSIEATTSALKAIATHMSGASHRNSIVWVTTGFPGNIDTNQEIRETIQAINDANVAVYPVDARGLTMRGIDPRVMEMREIAEYTGGVAYTMRNDVAQAIGEAIADPEHTYLLGFYLGNADLDGKLHKLHLTVDKPGVALNYRSGYTASPDPNTSRANAEPLESELLSPADSNGIGIEGKVTHRNGPAGKQLHIQLVLDRTNLPYAPNSTVMFSQMFAELDAQGRVLAKFTSDMSFGMPSPDRKAAYSQTIREREGAKQLRIVLQDKNTKRTGSLTIPL